MLFTEIFMRTVPFLLNLLHEIELSFVDIFFSGFI